MNSILTDNANRAIQGNVTMQVAKFATNSSAGSMDPGLSYLKWIQIQFGQQDNSS